MANLTPYKAQFFSDTGAPLVGGKLYTYAAGTSTPLATYTSQAGTSANTNPIILNSRGEADIWLSALSYKFALTTDAGAPVWTIDNVEGRADYTVESPDGGFTWVNAAAGQYWFFTPASSITKRPGNARWVLRCVASGDGNFVAGDEVDVTYSSVGNSGSSLVAGSYQFWYSQNGVLIVKDKAVTAANVTLTAARWDLKVVIMTR